MNFFVPDLVIVINKSGVPVLTVPPVDENILVAGLFSTIIDSTKASSGKNIKYVITGGEVLILKEIENRGNLVMLFKKAKKVEDVEWIATLFLNDLEGSIGQIPIDIVMGNQINAFMKKYEDFIKYLGKIDEKMKKLSGTYFLFRDIAGKYANKVLKDCSNGLIEDYNHAIRFNVDKLRNEKILAKDLIRFVNLCIGDIQEKMKEML